MSVPETAPNERAILIGGPRDGMDLTAEFVGQPIIRTPPVHRDLFARYGLMPTDVYRLQHDPRGFPSRDDAGRLRYQYERTTG